MFITTIFTLSIDRLRRGYNYLLYWQRFLHNQLIDQGSADTVHMKEFTEVRKIILVGSEMKNYIYVP
jgi:hypothetical protein